MLSSGAGSLFSRLWLPRTNSGLGAACARHRNAARRRILPARPSGRAGRPGLRLPAAGERQFFSSRWDSSWACRFPPACARSPRCPLPEFPAGEAASDNAVEWAWAMNAAASVLGSVLAMVIAIQFGLTVTLACGAAAYFARAAADARPAHESGLGRAPVLLSCCEGSRLRSLSCWRSRSTIHIQTGIMRKSICLARSSSSGRNCALGSR